MAKELYPSSFRCDCGKELHFCENTIKQMRVKSAKSPATLVADDSLHRITFTKGSATNIKCPKLGTVEIA
jgi:hypothetical protein